MRRFPALVMALAAAVAMCPRPSLASAETAFSFEQLAQAWMGAVTLLAHGGDEHEDAGRERGGRGERGRHEHGRGEHGRHEDGRRESCDCGDEGCERRAREGGRGEHGGGLGHGPRMHAAGPHGAVAKLDEILARLARIEAKLDGRSGGGPRGEWHGPRPPAGARGPWPEMPEQARRMMEERMKAARERKGEGGLRPDGRSEIPAEVREQMRQRMEEGRERMEQARQAFRQMEERIKKLEAEIQRLKDDR